MASVPGPAGQTGREKPVSVCRMIGCLEGIARPMLAECLVSGPAGLLTVKATLQITGQCVTERLWLLMLQVLHG